MSERIQLIQEDVGDVEQLFHLAQRGVEVSYAGLQGSQLATIAMAELVETDPATYSLPAIDFVEGLIDQADSKSQIVLNGSLTGVEATHVALALYKDSPGFDALARLDAAYETLVPETDEDTETHALEFALGSLRRMLRNIELRSVGGLAGVAEARMASSLLSTLRVLSRENVGDFSDDVVSVSEYVDSVAFELAQSDPEHLMQRYYSFFPDIIEAFGDILGDEQVRKIERLQTKKLQMLARFTDIHFPVYRGFALQALADLRDRFPEDKVIQRRARREARDIAVGSVFQRTARIEHPVEMQGKRRILEGTLFDMDLLTRMISTAGQYTTAAGNNNVLVDMPEAVDLTDSTE